MIHVVAALIISNNKFLVARRAKGELKGFWEFPGGKIEKNESSFYAIKREIKEELGLLIKPIKTIGIFSYKYNFAHISIELIECKLLSGEVSLIDGSHTEIQWVKDSKLINFAPLDKKIYNFLKREHFTKSLIY